VPEPPSAPENAVTTFDPAHSSGTAGARSVTAAASGPRATYRLQLTPEFTLRDAAAIVPYLAALGVSHVYLSPILQAVEGSTHGYDVADHSRINAELGGDVAFAELCAAAAACGLRLLVDIVPNHMAVTTAGGGRQNRQWWDILQRGPESTFAGWIDVDWSPRPGRAGPRVLLPVLGERYGRELVAGDLRLVTGGDGPEVAYHDHRFPLSQESLPLLGDGSQADLDAINGEPAGVAPGARLAALPAHLLEERDHGAQLPAVLRRDHARRAAGGGRACVRGDATNCPCSGSGTEPSMAAHRSPGRPARSGGLPGLARRATGGCWTLVEKILEPGEQLVPGWACDGTTGYDFMGVLEGVFVDPSTEAETRAIHDEFVGSDQSFEEVATQSKRLIIGELLVADTARVVEWGIKVCAADRSTADITAAEVRTAIEELLVAFPVYRTYVTADGTASDTDVAVVRSAAERVTGTGAVADELLAVLTGALLGEEDSPDAVELRARFQQLTGPAMAKSVEDTAFYRYLPLVSLNEVGADPDGSG
jgi:(1->4)-alpha-D-glucan 1-alpha-D-glucosylmutase